MRQDQYINSTEPITSVSEYIKKITDLINRKKADERIFVFRGETKKHPTFCQPNIFRHNVLSENKFYEKSLFNTMRQNKLSNNNSYLENAIDAQHGEFPSRLLDVSYNCLTALYFAVTPYYHKPIESLDSEDGMVYIFYIDDVFSPSAQNTIDNYNAIINKSENWFNEQIIFKKNHKFIDHTKINNRIIAQQGAFILFQGEDAESIPAYMMNGIIISHKAKAQIRNELSLMFGINTGTIYPEIMNIASDLTKKCKTLITEDFTCENEIKYVLSTLKKELLYYLEYLSSYDDKIGTPEFYESVQLVEQVINSYRIGFIKLSNDYQSDSFKSKISLKKLQESLCSYNSIVKDFSNDLQVLCDTKISDILYI